MSRIVVLVGVLLVMLLVPLYLAKERKNNARARAAATDIAERAIDAKARQMSAAAAPTQRNPDRMALTFGWSPTAAPDELYASCRGGPYQLANPHQSGCNHFAGDTSCRTVLPVLCLRPADGATLMALATSEPVAGFLIESRTAGDAHCAQALGARWRMANFVDGSPDLRAHRQTGIAVNTGVRAWVAVNDNPANCWDP